MADPVVLVVKRGALKRFEKLKRETSQLDVEVIWDRRERARREAARNAADDKRSAERRAAERRAADPFTWKTADFVVAVPSRSTK